MRRLLATCSAFFISVAFIPAATAQNTEFEAAFESLLVAVENQTGYDRNLFPHWLDADGNGCNARYEVLISEAIRKPRITGKCSLTGGRWISLFDNREISDPRQLDVDHFVPLAEAWRSGAYSWNQNKRTQFANDLGLPEALIAVTASSNRSKGDRDVANWLPSNSAYRCTYLASWVTVKVKWKLTVDVIERKALEDGLLNCGAIRNRTTPKLFTGSSNNQPKLQPSVQRFSNCTAARAAKVTPIRRSTNPALYQANTHLDRDKDGVACE
jgi:hypothetical protein